jgi:hypothetical protein
MKLSDAPLLFVEDFPMVSRVQKEVPWFGKSQCDKQTNPKPSFIDRFPI